MADGIQFNDEQELGFEPVHRAELMQSGESTGKPIIALVKKLHLAKSDAQAEYLLLGIGIVTLLAAAFIFVHNILGIGKPKQIRYDISPEQIAKFPPNIQKDILAAKKK